VNAWIRDGLAAGPHTFVLPLEPLDLPPSESGTPPQAMRRLLHPSFTTTMRQSAARGDVFTALRRALGQTMQARLGHRPIVGVPEGLGFAEWLADECDCTIVCLVSHPLAVAAHHKRLADHGDPARWIDRACREWLVASEWIAGYRERRRDFTFVLDDELISEPFVGFHRLYRQLGLPWSPRCQTAIAALMADDREDATAVRPDGWSVTLTGDEVARIREGTERDRTSHPWPRRGWPERTVGLCSGSEAG